MNNEIIYLMSINQDRQYQDYYKVFPNKHVLLCYLVMRRNQFSHPEKFVILGSDYKEIPDVMSEFDFQNIKSSSESGLYDYRPYVSLVHMLTKHYRYKYIAGKLLRKHKDIIHKQIYKVSLFKQLYSYLRDRYY